MTKQEAEPSPKCNCGNCGLTASASLIDAVTRRCFNEKMCAFRKRKAEQFAATQQKKAK